MHLLELGSGTLSLEFAPAEMSIVRRRLARMGRVSLEQHATYAVMTVGEERFLHECEWDDPCLIAQSAAGGAILRAVVAADDLPDRLAS